VAPPCVIKEMSKGGARERRDGEQRKATLGHRKRKKNQSAQMAGVMGREGGKGRLADGNRRALIMGSK